MRDASQQIFHARECNRVSWPVELRPRITCRGLSWPSRWGEVGCLSTQRETFEGLFDEVLLAPGRVGDEERVGVSSLLHHDPILHEFGPVELKECGGFSAHLGSAYGDVRSAFSEVLCEPLSQICNC